MTSALSRTLSPTVLLYSFVVITQLGFGIYLGQQIEAPGAYTLLHWAAQLWIIGWWLRRDSRKRVIGSLGNLTLRYPGAFAQAF